jgi:hypothetical protein
VASLLALHPLRHFWRTLFAGTRLGRLGTDWAQPSSSSSSRSSSRNIETERLEVPSPLAISASENPCEIGIAICLRIARPRGESRCQSIAVGIEAENVGPFPFVVLVVGSRDAGGQARPSLLFAEVVDDAELEDVAGVLVEAGRAFSVPAFVELPEERGEMGEKVFPFVREELEAAVSDDCSEEAFGVVDVLELPGSAKPAHRARVAATANTLAAVVDVSQRVLA